MKCQILYSGKNKKNIINLSSDESAHSVLKCIVFTLNILTNKPQNMASDQSTLLASHQGS